MTTSYQFPSPAKLNLFLHVNGQLDNGYHELQTLFQFIDYGDTLDIALTKDNKVTLLNEVAGVATKDNLIYKAAELLADKKANTLGAAISIDKKLPMGGGLGGGSSNAATVLLALNKLWQVNLPLEELAQLGLSLGADVPIFVHGFAAFADGVGEKLQPATPKEYCYLVCHPNVHISTQEVFTAAELPRNTPKISLENLDVEHSHNDCEQVVLKRYPEVAKLLAWLIEYAPSRMTGTGACVFARFSDEYEARRVQKLLPNGITSFVANGMNKSPVHAVVAQL